MHFSEYSHVLNGNSRVLELSIFVEVWNSTSFCFVYWNYKRLESEIDGNLNEEGGNTPGNVPAGFLGPPNVVFECSTMFVIFWKSKFSMFEFLLVSNVRTFECSMFAYIEMFKSSFVRWSSNFQMFECSDFLKSKILNVRMFMSIKMFRGSMLQWSLFFFSDPCSRVRRTLTNITEPSNIELKCSIFGGSYGRE